MALASRFGFSYARLGTGFGPLRTVAGGVLLLLTLGPVEPSFFFREVLSISNAGSTYRRDRVT